MDDAEKRERGRREQLTGDREGRRDGCGVGTGKVGGVARVAAQTGTLSILGQVI